MQSLQASLSQRNLAYKPKKKSAYGFSFLKRFLSLSALFESVTQGQAAFTSRDFENQTRRSTQAFDGCSFAPDPMIDFDTSVYSSIATGGSSIIEDGNKFRACYSDIIGPNSASVIKCGSGNKDGTGFTSVQIGTGTLNGARTHINPKILSKPGGGFYVFHQEKGIVDTDFIAVTLDGNFAVLGGETTVMSFDTEASPFTYNIEAYSSEFIATVIEDQKLTAYILNQNLLKLYSNSIDLPHAGNADKRTASVYLSSGNFWIALENNGDIIIKVLTGFLSEQNPNLYTFTGRYPVTYELPDDKFLFAYINPQNKPVVKVFSSTTAGEETSYVLDCAIDADTLSFSQVLNDRIGLAITEPSGSDSNAIMQIFNTDGSPYEGDLILGSSTSIISVGSGFTSGDTFYLPLVEGSNFVVKKFKQLFDPIVSIFNKTFLFVGENVTFPLRDHFQDPQSLSLNYSVVAEDGMSPSFAQIAEEQLVVTGVSGSQGNHTLNITGTNEKGRTATTQTQVEIFNRPPFIQNMTEVSMNVNALHTVSLNMGDADEDVLQTTITINNQPLSLFSFVSYNAAERTLTFEPVEGDQSTYNVKVSITDGFAEGEIEFPVTVENRPPFIQNVTEVSMNVNTSHIVSLNMGDADGDLLQTTITINNQALSLFSFVSYNAVEKTLTFEPTEGDQSAYNVKVSITDGFVEREIEFPVTVENRLPILNPMTDSSTRVGQTTVIDIGVRDLDGSDPLVTVKIGGKDISEISWASYNSQFKEISFSPIAETQGQYAIDVEATDPQGGKATESFLLTVPFGELKFSSNDPVTLQKSSGDTVLVNLPLPINEDNNPISYEGVNIPSWLVLHAEDGNIGGSIPSTVLEEEFTFQINLKDFSGIRDSMLFTLSVVSDQVLSPPERIREAPEGLEVPIGGLFTLDLSSEYFKDASHYEIMNLPETLSFNPSTKKIKGFLNTSSMFTFLAFNEQGGSNDMNIAIKAIDRGEYIPTAEQSVETGVTIFTGEHSSYTFPSNLIKVLPSFGNRDILEIEGTAIKMNTVLIPGEFTRFTFRRKREPKHWIEQTNITFRFTPNYKDTTGAKLKVTSWNDYGQIENTVNFRVQGLSDMAVSITILSVLGTIFGLYRTSHYFYTKREVRIMHQDQQRLKQTSRRQLSSGSSLEGERSTLPIQTDLENRNSMEGESSPSPTRADLEMQILEVEGSPEREFFS